MNATISGTGDASATGTRRCRCCIALIIALLILSPLAAYPPVHNYLQVRHAVALVQRLNAPSADVPGLLQEVSELDRGTQAQVLDVGKDKIIAYFASSAEAAIDQSKGHCDYDGALHILYTAGLYYPDSARLDVIRNNIQFRKVQAAAKTDAACQTKH